MMRDNNAFGRLGLELFGLALCLCWITGTVFARDEEWADDDTFDEDGLDDLDDSAWEEVEDESVDNAVPERDSDYIDELPEPILQPTPGDRWGIGADCYR